MFGISLFASVIIITQIWGRLVHPGIVYGARTRRCPCRKRHPPWWEPGYRLGILAAVIGAGVSPQPVDRFVPDSGVGAGHHRPMIRSSAVVIQVPGGRHGPA
jgi:hypothetical protein